MWTMTSYDGYFWAFMQLYSWDAAQRRYIVILGGLRPRGPELKHRLGG